MNRSVRYKKKKKICCFLRRKDAWMLLFLLLVNLANKSRPLLVQGKTYTKKIILAFRYYLNLPMNIYTKIRFGSSICIPKVLGNL